MTTRSPVTAAKPRRSAAPLPRVRLAQQREPEFVLQRVEQIAAFRRVDPSSTTISSMRSGTASTRRMISSIVVRSLYTGITTESSGFGWT